MAFQSVSNTAEVVVRMTADNQEILNTFHFVHPTGWSEGDLQQLTDGVKLLWDSNFIPILPEDCASVKVDGIDLRTAIGLYAETAWAAPASGGIVDAPMPNSVTLSIKAGTGLRGRSYRGRNYWPLTPRGAVTKNRYSNEYITSITAAYNSLVGPGTVADNWTMVVVSRKHLNADRATGLTTQIVQYSVVDNIVDCQRRRLPRRGV